MDLKEHNKIIIVVSINIVYCHASYNYYIVMIIIDGDNQSDCQDAVLIRP